MRSASDESTSKIWIIRILRNENRRVFGPSAAWTKLTDYKVEYLCISFYIFPVNRSIFVDRAQGKEQRLEHEQCNKKI